MIIDKKWLIENKACEEGKQWFVKEGITDPVNGVLNLLAKDKLSWANWLLIRLLSHQDKVRYACYAATQALPLFEKKYKKDKRPRKAIAAALKWAKFPSEENRKAAADAADAAAAADAAYAAAYAAADAAYAAAYAAANAAADAADAADAAYAAAYAAADAAYAAAYAAADAARAKVQKKIIIHGIKLLKAKDLV